MGPYMGCCFGPFHPAASSRAASSRFRAVAKSWRPVTRMAGAVAMPRAARSGGVASRRRKKGRPIHRATRATTGETGILPAYTSTNRAQCSAMAAASSVPQLRGVSCCNAPSAARKTARSGAPAGAVRRRGISCTSAPNRRGTGRSEAPSAPPERVAPWEQAAKAVDCRPAGLPVPAWEDVVPAADVPRRAVLACSARPLSRR